MLFQVKSGTLCEKIETQTHEEAVTNVFKNWTKDHNLALITECAVIGNDTLTKWFDTLSMLSKLSITHKVDKHLVHFTVI